MDVFELRNRVIADHADYVGSFIQISDQRIHGAVQTALADGRLWPEPLVQLSPRFAPGEPIVDLVANGVLHPGCRDVFRTADGAGVSRALTLHRHQVEAIHAARTGESYVLTTGTGSGKSLAYIVPIVDHVLRTGSGRGVQAVIVYPMNALANSQVGELEKYLVKNPSERKVTFAKYTGQEKTEERRAIVENPPDILLTNYVMLELLLTRANTEEYKLIEGATQLRFLVLDELHTYRGRQGADVALLVRRLRDASSAENVICVGTSATMSREANWPAQQRSVAEVSSRLFGARVAPASVIGETLKRLCPEMPLSDPAFRAALKHCLAQGDVPDPENFEQFRNHPLAVWVENRLGIDQDPADSRLHRCLPLSLTAAGNALSVDTDIDAEHCRELLQRTLLAGYACEAPDRKPTFAFRLHQFVSKGETVYASLEPEAERHITLQYQQFVPDGTRQRVLLPLAFCRECGQEYYVVKRVDAKEGTRYDYRGLSERQLPDHETAGYLYLSTAKPWPTEPEDVRDRLPESWLEDRKNRRVVKDSRRVDIPRETHVSGLGEEDQGQQRVHWIKAPFRFCLNCGVAYGTRQRSDFAKLASLGTDGRSTATTVMAVATIRELRRSTSLEPKAMKLLSFTDNRQDAALQAGHFNDFAEVGLVRSALAKAVRDAGTAGIRHEDLPERMFRALGLDLAEYAPNPNIRYLARDETDRALRRVLGYYVYRDLHRGWRLTSPNLEQTGLLRIDYLSLDELCADESAWHGTHGALMAASASTRAAVCRAVLDHLRRELAIRVEFLDSVEQEKIRADAGQRLVPAWQIDDREKMEYARLGYLSRASDEGDKRQLSGVFLTPMSGVGMFLRRPDLLQPPGGKKLNVADTTQLLQNLVDVLVSAGLLHTGDRQRGKADPNRGFQVPAAAMIWRAGGGIQAVHDPVRTPHAPEQGLRVNDFFVNMYSNGTTTLRNLEGREHTAQVTPELRIQREDDFRAATLPVLFCSPTMELGVDISELNVVNMRNVPPTPANYAQRSGRAGRSGQPAFLFTYCTAASPHDQYYFRQPEKMVAGSVTAPRLDLANEDLVRAHIHAVWLAAAKVKLGSKMTEVVDASGDDPTLAVQAHVVDALSDGRIRAKAQAHALEALGEVVAAMLGPLGSVDDWIAEALNELPRRFGDACDRWRDLYRSAWSQFWRQSKVMHDPSRDSRDRDKAVGLRNEAESQLRLLRGDEDGDYQEQSEFYPYRYLASEGFLPGYNFPRLPLAAFLPGRKRKGDKDEFLQRPRFLAVSEFGPRSLIYHEGGRYIVNKLILPADRDRAPVETQAALCTSCGYLHRSRGGEPTPDLCESCHAVLPASWKNLFRMQNVSARRRDRINSDEEERSRMGYEIKTGVRFADRAGLAGRQSAIVRGADGRELMALDYGDAATLWRMNLGWRRRQNRALLGYVLDFERGYWAKESALEDGDGEADTLEEQESSAQNMAKPRRVVPFVEDNRNAIIVRPKDAPTDLVERAKFMASFQAALKTAIQIQFQLEDRELAAEPLPDEHNRAAILIYEASEGGAGVLRRLVDGDDVEVFRTLAQVALDLCHFDSTGKDIGLRDKGDERCEAACYDCLLSYYNQRDHRMVDRKLLVETLLAWTTSTVEASPRQASRQAHLDKLRARCDSDLERRWLGELQNLGLRLPDAAQQLIEAARTRADFWYARAGLAVYIDGPHHDQPRQQLLDRQHEDDLDAAGIPFVRFHHGANWKAVFASHEGTFGALPEQRPSAAAISPGVDLDLIDPVWRPIAEAAEQRWPGSVIPGQDLATAGRVTGTAVFGLRSPGRTLLIIDDSAAEADDAMGAAIASGAVAVRLVADHPQALAQLAAAWEA